MKVGAASIEPGSALSQEIAARLGERVKNPCPLCGERTWSWAADLVMLRPRSRTPLEYPLLTLTCSTCGNTALLNVYALGLEHLWPPLNDRRVLGPM